MNESVIALPIDDLKVAAAAIVLGGHLERVSDDGRRLTFHFRNLPPDFSVQVLRGDLHVPLSRYVAALEQVHALVGQYRRARR